MSGMLRLPAPRDLCLHGLMASGDLLAITITLQQSFHPGTPHHGPRFLRGVLGVSGHPQTTPWEEEEEDGNQNSDGL